MINILFLVKTQLILCCTQNILVLFIYLILIVIN